VAGPSYKTSVIDSYLQERFSLTKMINNVYINKIIEPIDSIYDKVIRGVHNVFLITGPVSNWLW